MNTRTIVTRIVRPVEPALSPEQLEVRATVRSQRLRARCAMRGMRRYCILYLRAGEAVERQSPWFLSEARARAAFRLLRDRHGRAIIFVD